MATRKPKTPKAEAADSAAPKKAAPRVGNKTPEALEADAKARAHVGKQIEATALDVARSIETKHKPDLQFPIRSLQNVIYDEKKGYFEIGPQKKTRTLSASTARSFAQTLKMMAMSHEMVRTDDIATKREAYYTAYNWGEARFQDQPESDTVMDDIEAMFAVTGVTREQLRFLPAQRGGSVAGNLIIRDFDRESGEPIEIDCTKFGAGAYSIPPHVEHLGFETDAKFVLAVETGALFQRLNHHTWWRKANCVLVEMQGVPTRATRRFIRRLSEDKKIPVYAFVDCDPYGFGNIYRTLKVGSGNAAHTNRFFCVPWAKFLGVTPYDIDDYKLPTHPLKEVDLKRAKDALKNDPFFQHFQPWKDAINFLIKKGVRAEQQAFAKDGLNYVMDTYLPEKLANPRRFLP
jgi:DNA topoisomerase VI subunit A